MGKTQYGADTTQCRHNMGQTQHSGADTTLGRHNTEADTTQGQTSNTFTEAIVCDVFPSPPHQLFVDSNNGSAFLFCGPQLVTTVIVPDILLLASYIYGLYLVRFQLPEHFYSLMESVFLSFTWVPSANTQKRTRRVVAVLV